MPSLTGRVQNAVEDRKIDVSDDEEDEEIVSLHLADQPLCNEQQRCLCASSMLQSRDECLRSPVAFA